MAKDPVMPVYFNDLESATRDWTDEEFGAYVRLLIFQWDKGGIPSGIERLQRIITSYEKNWPLLKTKFLPAGDLLKNPVMEEIRLKRLKHKERQKINADKRWEKDAKHDATTYPTLYPVSMPLENEIEIEKEKNNINIPFSAFWDLYDKKTDRALCEKKWNKLSDQERTEAMAYIPGYKKTREKQFQRDPATFINRKTWENAIIETKQTYGKINSGNLANGTPRPEIHDKAGYGFNQ